MRAEQAQLAAAKPVRNTVCPPGRCTVQAWMGTNGTYCRRRNLIIETNAALAGWPAVCPWHTGIAVSAEAQ